MGYDAYIYVNKKHSKKSAENLLELMGYVRHGSFYYCGNDIEYKYIAGVIIWLCDENKNQYVYRVNSKIWAGGYDLKLMNDTIRNFKRYLGASFSSDYGRNRYFPIENLIKGAENGCYLALFNLENSFSGLEYYFSNLSDDSDMNERALSAAGILLPSVLTGNVFLSYLCSLMEDYYRKLFIALLRFSKNKQKIIDIKRINYDMEDFYKGDMSFEELYARSLSFQNINTIDKHFKKIDNKLDIGSSLKKPYHNRKKSLFDEMGEIFNTRHGIIHHLETNDELKPERVLRYIRDVKQAMLLVYLYLCDFYGWVPQVTEF